MITENEKLYYLFITLLIFWFFNTAYLPDIKFLISLLISVCAIYYFIKTKEQDVSEFNKDLNLKLNLLLKEEDSKPIDYLYTEPDLISFFYDIKDYRVYNRDSYLKAIKTANNLLKIREMLKNDFFYKEEPKLSSWQNFGFFEKTKIKNNIKNLRQMFEVSKHLANKSINYIHSFSINLPSYIYKEKHQKSLKRYQMLIKRILDDIYNHCKEYSNDPLITQDYGLPRPYSNEKNKAIDNFNFII